MNFDVLDQDGRELKYGDEVEYLSTTDGWQRAKIVAIKYLQTDKTVLKLQLNRMYLGQYRSYGHKVWVSNLNNLRKVN